MRSLGSQSRSQPQMPKQEIRQDLVALTRVHDFGMKLHRDKRTLAVGHGGNVAGLGRGKHFESCREPTRPDRDGSSRLANRH